MNTNEISKKVRKIVHDVIVDTADEACYDISDEEDLFDSGLLSSISLLFVIEKIKSELFEDMPMSYATVENFRTISSICAVINNKQ